MSNEVFQQNLNDEKGLPYQYKVFFTLFLCTLLYRSIEALS